MPDHESHPLYIDSTCTILTCTPEEFHDAYKDANIDLDDALLNTIEGYHDELGDKHYQLLQGMLLHAPTRAGWRYVAASLHIAHQKGNGVVAALARAWMDDVFIMMLAISRASFKLASTPAFDDLRAKLSVREDYRCAITRAFDKQRVHDLIEQRRMNEIPHGPQNIMTAVHIMPFLLNEFIDKSTTTPERARTWDMLRSWTGIDIPASSINTPANAVLLASGEHLTFTRFQLYFDKDAFPNEPNKYKVRMTRRCFYMSSGKQEADVEFPAWQAPNPDLLKIHAAFAKVLLLSKAADGFEWDDDERRLDPKPLDFARDLSCRLVISAM